MFIESLSLSLLMPGVTVSLANSVRPSCFHKLLISLSLSLFIRKEMQTIKNTKSSKTQNYTKQIILNEIQN